MLCTYDAEDNYGEVDTIPNLFSVVTKNIIDESDTTLVNHQSKTTTFSLPMSYALDTDTLLFSISSLDETTTTYNTVAKDTVYVNKTNTPHYEGYDCAPRFFHKIQKVWSTHHFIDTLKINNSSVQNNAASTNILLILTSGY